MWWIAILGCTGSTPPPPPERPAEVDPTPAIHLTEQLEFAELSVPDDSRDGAPLPTAVPLTGWEKSGSTTRGGFEWKVPTPFRPRGMFFHQPKRGMLIQRGGPAQRLPYRARPGGGGMSWRHDSEHIFVYTREDAPPDEALSFVYPRALEREARLHFRTAKAAGLVEDQADFVRSAKAQEGWTSREGLLLPAPGRASWKLTVPEDGMLAMEPGLVRPELADLAPSDGCTIEVSVTEGENTEKVFTRAYAPGEYSDERVDLSKWAGKEITLSMASLPGETSRYDLCFVGGPIVTKRKDHPRRVILVFVDTLRPDHLGTYGYDRDTSPNLDRFAQRGTVFTEARSIAPWTLPSARTVITGHQPELYDRAATLPAILGERGFATAMFAGNVYLSANFDMHRDWDHHEVGMFPPADQVTDQALAWMEQHQGQDQLVQLHYMSAHLPYLEPLEHRNRFAGAGPIGLQGEFHLPAVRSAVRKGLDEEGKQYIRDRYDNCIYWIDEQLERLYAQLEPEDVLVFFSDHGEEFWDHGGYEHGHTLYDELLRVPLIIKGPGMPAGRVDAPTSLLDVAPTVLDLLDIDAPTQGVSLVAAASGDAKAIQALEQRTQAFGRPLYGNERWGVLDHDRKWTTTRGQEEVFDLEQDPGETTNLRNTSDLDAYRRSLGEALDTVSGVGWRFLSTRNSNYARQTDLEVTVTGGIDRAWFGEDALQRSMGSVERLSDETVRLTWHKGYRGTREAYVLPKDPIAKATTGLSLRVRQGEAPYHDIPLPQPLSTEPDGSAAPLHSIKLQDGALRMTHGIAPAVDDTWLRLDATDDETEDWLEKLGYVDREDQE